MAYVSLALKYRPQTFSEIVGQPHVSVTLRNAVASGHVSHAYLFAGPRGTGKTTTARVLAKALNCVEGPTPDPCGECEQCVAIRDGTAMDVAEIDAASNRGIDEIRDLREKVKFRPASGRCKVYILDEVHMLTNEAFNALLKTLEEPPAHAFFVLATTEPYKVPPTILSRCQRFDFRQIPVAEMTARMAAAAEKEGLQVEGAALAAVARAAQGAMRDAWSILDQVIAYCDERITAADVQSVLGVTEQAALERAVDIIARSDVPGVYALVAELVAEGKDIGQFLRDLTVYFRDLFVIALGCRETELLRGEGSRAKLEEQAQALGARAVRIGIETLAQAQNELRQSGQHQLLLEITLARLAHPARAAAARAGKARPARAEAVLPSGGGAKASEQDSAAVPTAAPGPTAPAAAPGGEVTLEAVRGCWGQLEQYFREHQQMAVWACLRVAEVTGCEGGRVTLGFPPNAQFHAEHTREKQDEVEEALKALLRAPVKVRCVLAEEEAPPRIVQPELAERAGEQGVEQPAEAPAKGASEPPASPEEENDILSLFPGSKRLQ